MSSNYYLSKIIILATAIGFAFIVPALLVLYIDPFQIFHKSYLAETGLTNNQRFQNAGLINSYLLDPDEGYDSVMIGSSVSTNFTSGSAASALGWNKPLRLFMDGGDPSQLALILSRALDTHKVHHVLWELSPRAYSPPRYFFPTNDYEFPYYLYNDNLLDNFRYIFNYDVLKLSWKYFISQQEPPYITPNTLGYQANNPLVAIAHQKFNSPENLKEHQLVYQEKYLIFEQEKNMGVAQFEYPVLEQIVFPVLLQWCNTDIKFVLFIPPISKIDYLGNQKFVFRSIYMVNAIVNKIENCSNIRLHAFDTMSFTGDLNNYIDKIHYRPNVSEKILRLMGERQYIVNTGSFEKYKLDFISSLENYHPHSSYPADTEF